MVFIPKDLFLPVTTRAAMRTFLLFLTTALILGRAHAQLLSARVGVLGIGVNGNNATLEQAIRSLEYVEEVKFEQNNKAAVVTFKPNSETSVYQLGDKIRRAGFSIWFMEGVAHFNNLEIRDNDSYGFQTFELRFVRVGKKKVLNGNQTFTFVGKDFLNKGDYRKWKPYIKEDQKIAGKSKDIYYVTL